MMAERGDEHAGLRLGTYYRVHLLRRLGFGHAPGRVLDIGGRDGRWAASVAAAPVLVDVDPLPVVPGVEYVVGSGGALPLRDGAFDCVYTLDVIEHVPDEVVLLGEALRVLRPGGMLVVTTPSVDMHVFPARTQAWVDRRWGHHRVRGFDTSYLERVLRELGARDVRVRPLAMTAFRALYFPLRLVWAIPGPAGRLLVRLAAAFDARRPWGRGGAVLVEACASVGVAAGGAPTAGTSRSVEPAHR